MKCQASAYKFSQPINESAKTFPSSLFQLLLMTAQRPARLLSECSLLFFASI